MKVARQISTPEQLETAILTDSSASPCRYVYAAEVWPEGDPDHRWRERVPPHAVIHALRRDIDSYAEVLQRERGRADRAEQALSEVHNAVDVFRRLLTPVEEP